MDRISKFLNGLPEKQRGSVISAIFAIERNELDHLDVKPMKGKKHWYRCRIGKVRIIFVRMDKGRCIVSDVDWRSRIYRKK